MDELAAMLGRESLDIAAPGQLEALYRQRDSVLMRWLDLNAKRLRLLVSLLENILDPQTIVVGGHFPAVLIDSLIDRAYPLLLPSVREATGIFRGCVPVRLAGCGGRRRGHASGHCPWKP